MGVFAFINCTTESKLHFKTAFNVNSVNTEHMNFTTKEELDICDTETCQTSQFVLVKISYKDSFYIHDTSISVVLNQKHDEQLRHCQIQVFTCHSPTFAVLNQECKVYFILYPTQVIMCIIHLYQWF